jgi:signal peptidase I
LSKIFKIIQNEYVKSGIVIAIIVITVLGVFFSLRFALNTDVPVRVVESGSMCVPYGYLCDGWSHVFDQTLHVGDIIIIQGVKPEELNANYPNSDVIVYINPTDLSATPIVHRIVERNEVNGILYFQTKGDGNPSEKWPDPVSPSDYDSQTLWPSGPDEGVPENLVLGKVVMRIPWFGHITLFLQRNPYGLPVIIALIILLLVIEFIIPIVKKTKEQETKNENVDLRV